MHRPNEILDPKHKMRTLKGMVFVKPHFVISPLLRKRKREVLEEEESVSEGECEKFKANFGGLPDEFDLPVDTTGAMYRSSTCFDPYSKFCTLIKMYAI